MSNTIKTDLDKHDITNRLYSIRNIAYLAAQCEEKRVDVCLLQNTATSLVGMIQALIDDIGA